MKSLNKKTIGFWILIVVTVLVVLSLIVRFNEKITGPARIASQYEWTIVHLEQDKLSTLLKSNGLIQKQQVELFHLSRPDYITFSLKDGLTIGQSLNQGELVAQFISLEDQYRITNLQGDLAQARAQLSAQSTGLKRAQQEEADQELQFSKAQLAAYRPIVERQRELYNKQVISRQELEITEAQNQLYEIEVALREAGLRSARSGEKSELLSIIQTQITAAASELSLLNSKAAASMIHAPFSGILVQPVDSLGEKLHLCKNDTFVVQMPVDAAHIHSVKAGQP
ncbi:MAG: hypothetical protein EHM72_04500, partial [Calditrichaeota bacterium]